MKVMFNLFLVRRLFELLEGVYRDDARRDFLEIN